MRVYLVCHLATEYNKRGLYVGTVNDPPVLSESTANFLERFERLRAVEQISESIEFVASPARRCIDTIKLMAEQLGSEATCNLVDAFNETNYGFLAGHTRPEIRNGGPQLFDKWMADKDGLHFPRGETYEEVQERAFAGLSMLIAANKDCQQLIICSHSDVIKMLICCVLELPIGKRRLFRIDCGSISCLEACRKSICVKFLNYQ